jgi:hypothetical protein
LLPGALLGSVIERLALNPSASAAGMSVLSQSGSRSWGSEGLRPNARRRASLIIKPCHPHQKPTEPSARQRSPVPQMPNREHPAIRSVQRSHIVQSPGSAFTPGARGAPRSALTVFTRTSLTGATVFASAPLPTRTVTPSISTSMVPLVWRPRCRRATFLLVLASPHNPISVPRSIILDDHQCDRRWARDTAYNALLAAIVAALVVPD